MSDLLPLGQVVATPGAIETADRNGIFIVNLLMRHAKGDDGDLDAEDKATNIEARKHGMRVLSAYGEGDSKLWVITEADRSSTCVLRPDEY